MKLAKALKEKNRLVGEIVRIKSIIERDNSRNVKSPAKTDCATLWVELNDTVQKLTNIKTAIFKANIGIYSKIVTMGELKAKAQWIKTLNTKDGAEEVSNYRNDSTKTEHYVAHVKQEDVDRLTIEIQAQIVELQDELDEYNATVNIEV
jgi:hypothetical protein